MVLAVVAVVVGTLVAWWTWPDSAEEGIDSITYRAVGTLATTTRVDGVQLEGWARALTEGEVPERVAASLETPLGTPGSACTDPRATGVRIGTTDVCVVPIESQQVIRISTSDRRAITATTINRALSTELIAQLEAEAELAHQRLLEALAEERAALGQRIAELEQRLDPLPAGTEEHRRLSEEHAAALQERERLVADIGALELDGPAPAPLRIHRRAAAGIDDADAQ